MPFFRSSVSFRNVSKEAFFAFLDKGTDIDSAADSSFVPAIYREWVETGRVPKHCINSDLALYAQYGDDIFTFTEKELSEARKRLHHSPSAALSGDAQCTDKGGAVKAPLEPDSGLNGDIPSMGKKEDTREQEDENDICDVKKQLFDLRDKFISEIQSNKNIHESDRKRSILVLESITFSESKSSLRALLVRSQLVAHEEVREKLKIFIGHCKKIIYK